MDPADPTEKTLWSEGLLPANLQCEDLEDPKGHYALLEGSKVTSDADLLANYKRLHGEFKELSRTHHPDKTSDPKMIELFTEGKVLDDRRKIAHDVLCVPNMYGNAYPTRVDYDRTGESLRKTFKEKFDLASGFLRHYVCPTH